MVIKCHSGFVHYNMFHNGCHGGGGNNYGSIFNITNNCSGGTGFWGGLGAGLGFGLGNMFGGLFGNMFSGFGMGNMFGMGGFGMGNFGFGGWGNGFGNLWGGGGAGNTGSDYSRYSSNRSSCNCKCGNNDRGSQKCDDKDYDKINKLHEKANDLCKNAKSPQNDNDIDALIKELETLKKDGLDAAHKAENEEQIDNIIKQLKAAKSTTQVNPNDSNPSPVDNGDNINSLQDLEKMSPEDIGKLTADKAKEILNNLGYIDADGVGKMSANYKVLLLLQKAGINVKCVQGTAADPLIAGKISNVQLDSTTNKVSYDVDASSYPNASYKYKYSFKQGNDVNGKKAFNITAVNKNSSTTTGYVLDNLANENFLFQGEKQPLSGCGKDVIKNKSDSNHRTAVA